MALSNGSGATKIALIAAAAVGGFLIFGGSSSASTPAKTTTDPCDALRVNFIKIAATVTASDIPALQLLKKQVHELGCSDLETQIDQKIKDVGGTVVTPPKKTSTGPGSTFIAANAKDPVRAYSLAIAFSNAKPSPEWAAANPGRIDHSNDTFNTLADYAAYPGNGFSITQFQDASGLIADGKVGAQTNAAYFYWLGHGGKRPDGSMDVRVTGDAMCASCGHESATVGSCCKSCSEGSGGCGDRSAEEQIEAILATDPQFGSPWGGMNWGGNGFGGAGENPKPDIGGCSTGTCSLPAGAKIAATLQGESPAQKRALRALGALRSKVGGEFGPLLNAAEDSVNLGGDMDLSKVPIIPGSEPIIECLRAYVQERALAPA